jgi:hypothetical protein
MPGGRKTERRKSDEPGSPGRTSKDPKPETPDSAGSPSAEAAQQDSAGVYYVPIDVFEWRPSHDEDADEAAKSSDASEENVG